MTIKGSMSRGALVLAAVALVVGAMQTAAAQSAPTPEQLMRMIEAQQRQLDDLKAALKRSRIEAEAAANAAAQRVAREAAAEATKSSILDKVQVGGVAEVEITHADDFNGTGSSDIALATLEVFFDSQLHDYLSTHVQFLYEDTGDTINFDEALVTVGNTEKFPVYLQFGKAPQAFGGQGGGFDTDMSTDPLTKNMGEIAEAAVEVGAVYEGLTVRGYIYNGDTQKAGDTNAIDQFGLAAAYGGERHGASYNVGVSYVNNIADSGGFTDAITNDTSLTDYVPGIEVHGDFAFNDFVLRGAYMRAMDSFQSGEVAFNGRGAQPSVWHAELAYTMRILDRDWTLAGTVQGSHEATALSLPELRVGGAVTVGVMENFAVTLEYLHDEDYDTGEGGTGNDSHTATVKLAAEF